MAEVELKEFGIEHDVAKFDLTVSVSEGAGGLYVGAEYAQELYEGASIERLMGHWRRVLEEVVREEAGGIGQLGLLSEGEREQLLVEWNRTERDYGAARCIH